MKKIQKSNFTRDKRRAEQTSDALPEYKDAGVQVSKSDQCLYL